MDHGKEKETGGCFSCKVISVCTFVGIGSYLIYRGKSQAPTSKYSMYFIGTIVAALGVGEMFDKSPFR